MLDNAFPEAGISDLKFLVPIMYLLLVMAMVFSVRSISGTFVNVLGGWIFFCHGHGDHRVYRYEAVAGVKPGPHHYSDLGHC